MQPCAFIDEKFTRLAKAKFTLFHAGTHSRQLSVQRVGTLRLQGINPFAKGALLPPGAGSPALSI